MVICQPGQPRKPPRRSRHYRSTYAGRCCWRSTAASRRGDLVRLPWLAYDGRTLKLKQGKTGAVLTLPVHPVLKAELGRWEGEQTASTLILVNKFGRPWNASNLSKQLQDGLARIDGFPSGRNIHGLRKLAAINLAECGCSLHEIGPITGHRDLRR